MRRTAKLACAALVTVSVTALGAACASADGGKGPNGDDKRRSADGCQIGADGSPIRHIVHLQFDNVHLRRDNPNVPSDFEQMPNLLNFLMGEGVLLTNHFTPLISHTSVDILTTLTGVYGDKMGIPIGNSFGLFSADAKTVSFPASFQYWTDVAADGTPFMLDKVRSTDPAHPKVHPAPWVAFTRAGCDVGAFSVANIEFENISGDINNVFGPSSPEAAEAKANPAQAIADFEGIAIHCAKGSALCAAGKPDVLTDEPGGYVGFNALFGNKNVAPAITTGPVLDLDGTPVRDLTKPNGIAGFPGFDPTPSQTLGYLATMLEAGVPVVYGYINDAHDRNPNAGPAHAFGPGEAEYVQQLETYDAAFGKFFARLAKAGITKDNTLFVVTADENDHFAGGPPSPANCDGVTVPCTYAKIGEVNGDLSRLLVTERNNATAFSVHSDSAPTFYILGNRVNGDQGQTDLVTRALEKDVQALQAVNPITGNTDTLTQRMADVAQQDFLHMITADPNRTPNFIMFANADYFLSASTNKTKCAQPLCQDIVAEPAPGTALFAWNHGDFQPDITNTFLGLVGPGVQRRGLFGGIFSDHTDTRPTMLSLAGLKDDYAHDGRVLFEVLDEEGLPDALHQDRDTLSRLAARYKDINAPLGTLGRKTLELATAAINADDLSYEAFRAKLEGWTARRNLIAGQMIALLEGAAFDGRRIDGDAAKKLIDAADALIADVH
jgi:hypothetical protein